MSPEDILRVLKRLKISRLHTFRRNGVDTLERKMWPLCEKRCGHFWNNPQIDHVYYKKLYEAVLAAHIYQGMQLGRAMQLANTGE